MDKCKVCPKPDNCRSAGQAEPDCVYNYWEPLTFFCNDPKDQAAIISGIVFSFLGGLWATFVLYNKFKVGCQRLDILQADLKQFTTHNHIFSPLFYCIRVAAITFLIDKIIRLHHLREPITIRALCTELPIDEDQDRDLGELIEAKTEQIRRDNQELRRQVEALSRDLRALTMIVENKNNCSTQPSRYQAAGLKDNRDGMVTQVASTPVRAASKPAHAAVPNVSIDLKPTHRCAQPESLCQGAQAGEATALVSTAPVRSYKVTGLLAPPEPPRSRSRLARRQPSSAAAECSSVGDTLTNEAAAPAVGTAMSQAGVLSPKCFKAHTGHCIKPSPARSHSKPKAAFVPEAAVTVTGIPIQSMPVAHASSHASLGLIGQRSYSATAATAGASPRRDHESTRAKKNLAARACTGAKEDEIGWC